MTARPKEATISDENLDVQAPLPFWAVTTVAGSAAGVGAVAWRLQAVAWHEALVLFAAAVAVVLSAFDLYRHRDVAGLRFFVWLGLVGMVSFAGGAVAEISGWDTVTWLCQLLRIATGLGFIGYWLVRRANSNPRETPMIFGDIAFQTSAWALAMWTFMLRPDFNNGESITWKIVALSAFIVLGVALVSAYATTHLVRPTWPHVVGFTLFMTAFAANAIRIGMSLERFDASWQPAMNLCLAVAFCLIPFFTWDLKASLEPPSINYEDGGRSYVVAISGFCAVALVCAVMAKDQMFDYVSLGITCVLVASYFGREVVHGNHTRRLVENSMTIALTDPLTGLGNRRALMSDLHDMTHDDGEINRTLRPVTLFVLDLDRFKEVNKRFGHAYGDRVLIAVSEALTDVSREQENVHAFRLGSDEFAVIVDGPQSKPEDIAGRLRGHVTEVVGNTLEHMGVTSCVGFTTCHPDVDDVDDAFQMVTQATEALRVAKLDRDRVQEYTPSIAAAVHRRSVVEERLREALDRDELQFAFQPIVQLKNNRIVGFETLARWSDSELGFVPPSEFVEVAENTGMVHDLGQCALKAAARVSSSIRRAGLDVFVTVNVSPLQLRARDFTDRIVAVMADFGLPHDAIKIEITENIFMDDDDPAAVTVAELSEHGFTIALDDFGTGYSSLGYMARMPFSVIKLDRSLTRQINDPTIRSVVAALVAVSKSQHTSVVPEGVETEEMADELAALGVEWAQGWLWSKAVPTSQLTELLQTHGHPTAHLDVSEAPNQIDITQA